MNNECIVKFIKKIIEILIAEGRDSMIWLKFCMVAGYYDLFMVFELFVQIWKTILFMAFRSI